MKFFLNHVKAPYYQTKHPPTWIAYSKNPSLAILAQELPDTTLDILYQRLALQNNHYNPIQLPWLNLNLAYYHYLE